MVWVALSSTGLSKLHMVPHKTLKIKCCVIPGEHSRKKSASYVQQTRTTGLQRAIRLPHPMLEMILLQDGASARHVRTTSKWLEDHKINF